MAFETAANKFRNVKDSEGSAEISRISDEVFLFLIDRPQEFTKTDIRAQFLDRVQINVSINLYEPPLSSGVAPGM